MLCGVGQTGRLGKEKEHYFLDKPPNCQWVFLDLHQLCSWRKSKETKVLAAIRGDSIWHKPPTLDANPPTSITHPGSFLSSPFCPCPVLPPPLPTYLSLQALLTLLLSAGQWLAIYDSHKVHPAARMPILTAAKGKGLGHYRL